jgi:hypothetical protein
MKDITNITGEFFSEAMKVPSEEIVAQHVSSGSEQKGNLENQSETEDMQKDIIADSFPSEAMANDDQTQEVYIEKIQHRVENHGRINNPMLQKRISVRLVQTTGHHRRSYIT